MPAVSCYVVVQYLAVLAVLAALGAAASQHSVPRSHSFILFAACVACISVGYLLEITSLSEGGALAGLRLQYLALPFVGAAFYIFTRDYCGTPLRGRFTAALLLAFPVAVLLVALAWPPLPLLVQSAFFVRQNGFSHLVLEPGPLHTLNAVYGYGLFAAAWVAMGRCVARHTLPNVLRHLVVFTAVSAVVLAAQAAVLLRLPASGFNTLPAALSLGAAVFGAYLLRYRIPAWRLQGRGYVVEQMEDAYILLDVYGLLLDANAKAREYFPALKGLAPGARPPLADLLPQAEPGGGENVFALERDGGEPLYLHMTRTELVAGGKPAGTSIMLYDISEPHHLLEELRQMATLDSLTGLNNRGAFFIQAQRDFDLSLRKSEAASLLLIDIDHFKQVNDEHGHLAGDQVLVTIADILLVRLRHTDIVGRYGGEEIVVWLPGATIDGAFLIADVIRRALEHTPFESERGRFHVTLSIGVAGLDAGRHRGLEGLIADADEALYLAKEGGRNKVVVFRPQPPPA